MLGTDGVAKGIGQIRWGTGRVLERSGSWVGY